MSDIVDKGIVRGDQRAILEIGGLMLLMSIVATVCAIAGSYYSSKVATGFGRILRGAIFARVEHFSIHQFDRFGSASLVTRTTNDTTQVQQMLIMMLTMVITAPMMAIGGVILALSQDTAAGVGADRRDAGDGAGLRTDHARRGSVVAGDADQDRPLEPGARRRAERRPRDPRVRSRRASARAVRPGESRSDQHRDCRESPDRVPDAGAAS